MKSSSIVMLLCLALSAQPAFAQARLVRSAPAEGARIKSPRHIVLTFSEALEPAFSGALLMDMDGRNLSGDPVKVSGRRITLTPARLMPGPYIVSWHCVGHDGHRVDGHLHFHVRA
jgi:methionine-rich copper-binding protein CopC